MPLDSSLLKCPMCSAPLQINGSCPACGADYQKHGILDFVGGAFHTKLDEGDYDSSHKISFDQSDQTFQSYRTLLGSRLPDQIGNVLEIGCGTGNFTTGLLRAISVENAVLTDVSPQMLEQCGQKLLKAGLDKNTNIVLATYSGNEDCFQQEAFDWCFGASVVHHILDVPDFFKNVRSWLRQDGRALFIEPSMRYHWALLLTATDTALTLLSRNASDDAALQILNWISIVRYAIVHAGDLVSLERIEDKHLFTGEYIADVARSAGFSRCDCMPFGFRDDGRIIFSQYLERIGVSQSRADEVLNIAAGFGANYFNLLHPCDDAPLYLIYLERGPTNVAQVPPRTERIVTPRRLNPAPRAHLTLAWQEGKFSLAGWVCSPIAVRRLVVQAAGTDYVGSVWLPRPDVQRVVNAKNEFPPIHAMFSGVNEVFEGLGEGQEIVISADTVEGVRIDLGRAVAGRRAELSV